MPKLGQLLVDNIFLWVSNVLEHVWIFYFAIINVLALSVVVSSKIFGILAFECVD